MKKVIFLLFLCLGLYSKSHATHLMGADLTYKSLGGGKYLLTFRAFRDCSGIRITHSNIVARCSTNTIVISNQTKVSVKDITGIRSNCPDTSRCGGGSYPYGLEEHVWTATLDISTSACCEWEISWEQCCRSSHITTGLQDQNFYTVATLNKCVAGDNSSPVFTQLPARYICLNQDFQYNIGAVDSADGDSLSYALVPGLQAYGTSATYIGQYTPARPMKFLGFPDVSVPYPGGFRLTNNGDLLFRPIENAQIGVIVIEVTEWRKDVNGVWQPISKTQRDMQLTVISCTNKQPTFKHIPLQWELCANDSVCIDIETSDADLADTTYLSTIGAIAGASYSIHNGERALLRFCWRPKSTDIREKPHVFYIKTDDNACPKSGESIRSVQIFVTDTSSTVVSAGNDTSVDYKASSVRMNGSFVSQVNHLATWRSLGDGYFNDSNSANATYFPGVKDKLNCSVKLVYSANAISFCGVSYDTMQLYFDYISFNSPQDIYGVKTDTVRLSANNSNGQPNGEYWHSLGDGYFDNSAVHNPLYHFGAADLLNCEVKFVLINDKNKCHKYYDTITVSRQEDAPDAGPGQFSITSDSVKLNGSTHTLNNRQPYWYTLGDGYFTDSSDMGTYYHLGLADRINCEVKLVLANKVTQACFVMSDTVVVSRFFGPVNAGSDRNWFSGDSIQLAGISDTAHGQLAYWSTNGDGTFSDINDLNAWYFPGVADRTNCGIYLKLTSYVSGICPATFDSVMLVQKEKDINSGTSANRVSEDEFLLNGITDVANGQLGYWVTLGDGHFDDSLKPDAKYFPGINDKTACETALLFKSRGNGNCDTKTDSFFIYQLAIPFNITVTLDSTILDTLFLNTTPVSDHITWSSNGTGTFGSGNPDYYLPSAQDKQMKELTIIGNRNHCGVSSDTLSLNTILISSVKNAVLESRFTIYPNPTENRLTIVAKSGELLSRAEVYDLKGSRLLVTNFEAGGEYVVEMSSLAPGNYVLTFTNTNGNLFTVMVQKR